MPRRFPRPVIGIVGGVGSGKSAIAREASQHRPWFVLDADRLGHQTLELPEVIAELTMQFGETILNSSGTIDRDAVAKRVFGSGQTEARKKLESIVHPHIRRQASDRLEEAALSGDYEILILDAAVLLEAGWDELCDAVVFVETPFEIRLNRVELSRGWNEAELRRRDASQYSVARKRELADVVIRNESELNQAVKSLLAFADERFPGCHESPN